MRKTYAAIAVAVALGLGGVAIAGAQAAGAMPMAIGIWPELGAVLQEMNTTQIGTLTVGDLAKLAGQLSIAEQRLRYVQRARHASLIVPGAGQFMTGNPGAGSLFLAGDLTVFAGTLLGAYFLLPTNVQFSSLDYLNAPLQTICNTWQGNSLLSYLPSVGVMAGGMILNHILAHFSSVEAAREARKNITDGKVTFTPNFNFGMMGQGFGMGMMMRY